MPFVPYADIVIDSKRFPPVSICQASAGQGHYHRRQLFMASASARAIQGDRPWHPNKWSRDVDTFPWILLIETATTILTL